MSGRLADKRTLGSDLEKICREVKSNVDLSQLSRWKIGGPASWVVEPSSVQEVMELVRYLGKNSIRYLVIGDTSNILFDDAGVDAVVIRIGRGLSKFRIDGLTVTCDAGVWVPKLARNVGCAGLTGMEHTIGIPGTLGGLICMNGGSQRKGIGENVSRVLAVNKSGELVTYSKEDCGFAYRQSIFQDGTDIVVGAVMEFSAGDPRKIRHEMIEIMRSRREKFPLKQPNCGSVFVSDPKLYETIGPPGKAIETLGLKGEIIGGAMISSLHANFIVNNGGAHARDVLQLISLARGRVLKNTGCFMKCEIIYVGVGGLMQPIVDIQS